MRAWRDMPAADGHWLLGSAREMRVHPHRFPAELALRHGGIARFRILHRGFIAVSHPDLIREVLVTRHERYERSFHYRNTELAAGRGLIATDGPHWRLRRRQVQPAFRPEHLRRIVPAVQTATAEMLARWEHNRLAGAAVPVVAEMQMLTLTVMCRALLSAAIAPEQARELGRMVRESLQLVRRKNTSLCPVPHWVPSPTHRALKRRRDQLDKFLAGHLEPRRLAGAEPRADIAQALLDARDPETGEALSWEALLDEGKTLFAAGFETTATALAWTLHLLSQHPAIAAAWHAELDRVLGERAPQWEDIARLELTGRIFSESMRLYPPVYNLGRVCREEDVLGGFRIRRGETLLLSVFGAHRTPEYWPQPEQFDPDRFAPGREPAKHAFLPFALGKHLCVGAEFARVEAVLVLAAIGRRYRLVPVVDGQVPASPQITLVPAQEIPLRLEPRTG
jgi:cytochrome P450